MTYQMDDETFHALRAILDDYSRDDPAGTRGGDNPDIDIESKIERDIDDLERLDRAYKIVGEWYGKLARKAQAEVKRSR
jgi:hypothetical protein